MPRLLSQIAAACSRVTDRGAARHAATAALLAIGALVVPGPVAANDARFDEGLLWRVERPGVPPSLVFGTLHVSDPRIVRFAVRLGGAIAASRVVATEIPYDRTTLERARQRMTLPAGQSLRALLGERGFERLAAELRPLGITAAQADRLTPLAAIGQLVVRPDRSVGTLDARIAALAGREGVPATGLETPDEQFDAVGDAARETAILEELRIALEESGRFRAFVDGLVAHYRNEQVRDLLALVRAGFTRAPQAAEGGEDPVLDRRSGILVERMLPMVAGGAAFVAVGAAHLAGPHGVLSRLEAAGWQVSRMPMAEAATHAALAGAEPARR